MPLTKHSLVPTPCAQSRCSKNATHTVMNERRWIVGDYCEKHADQKVKQWNKTESSNDGSK